MEWIKIEDELPDSGQPINAIIDYNGKLIEVKGCHSNSEEKIVLFDFYSGTAGGRIIKWKPRILPRKKNAHPWTGIENWGINNAD